MKIDISFDFRSDAAGKDPDTFSPTLKRYHQHLWSKRLPCGHLFGLDAMWPGAYLHHHSERGKFVLASDSVIPSFTRWKSMRHIVELFSEEENEAFRTIGYTIGGMLVFPGNKVDGKQTINGARGFNRKIADRLDLTLECLRRYYMRQESPLSDTLARYSDFFELFGSFKGYVDFFILQDLVLPDYSGVRFFMPFDNFVSSSVPQDRHAYSKYRESSMGFVHARNARIDGIMNRP
jgi:hypothetical protein